MNIDLSSQKPVRGEYDWSDNTPYSAPEKYGFERIAELEWDNESYQFNITCVLRRLSDKTLWYADDSGCSCPTPFEDTYVWERVFNTDLFEKRYTELTAPREYRSSDGPDLHEYNEFIAKVKAALAELSAE